MIKDLDKRIDKALDILANSKDCIASSSDLGENKNVFGDNNIVILLVDRGLSERTDDKEFVFDLMLPTCRILPKGIEIVKNGGWIEYLKREARKSKFNSKKEKLEFDKSKVDLKLAKKMLEEFPKTKWFARIGFIIGIVLMLKELYILLLK